MPKINPAYSAIPTESTLIRGRVSKRFKIHDSGLIESKCSKCKKYYPWNTIHFAAMGPRVSTDCRACRRPIAAKRYHTTKPKADTEDHLIIPMRLNRLPINRWGQSI